MTLAPVNDLSTDQEIPTPLLDRFTVVASSQGSTPMSESVRSGYVEEAWLPLIGPTALLFARRCDHLLAHMKDGEKSVSVNIRKWAEALGVYPEEVLGAKNRLLRFALAVWEEKGNVLHLHRQWPPVADALITPKHKSALLSLQDEIDA